MTAKTVAFLGKVYAPTFIPLAPDPKPINIDLLGNSELLDLYNLVSANLGRGRVKRFADAATAKRRTWAILEKYEAEVKQMAEPIVAQVNRATSKKPAAQLSPADKKQVADEAKARKPTPQSEQLLSAAAAAGAKSQAQAKLRTSPPPSGDAAKDAEMPILRKTMRPINLEPKNKVYARKAGSKQATLVDLLSRPQGATFGELYDALAATGKPWRGVTIRSGLAWDMNHVAGYGISSELLNGEEFAQQGRAYEAQRLGMVKRKSGWAPGEGYDPEVRMVVYRLTYPKGMDSPLPHIERKA
jgi:hypothetical protein